MRDKFSAVPDAGIAPPRFAGDAVTPAQGGTLIRMVPQRDGHSIELQASSVCMRPCFARCARRPHVSALVGE